MYIANHFLIYLSIHYEDFYDEFFICLDKSRILFYFYTHTHTHIYIYIYIYIYIRCIKIKEYSGFVQACEK